MYDVNYFIAVITFSVILLLITLALIFNKSFRDDMIAADGEITYLGFLSAKGAMVLGFCTLFVGGIIGVLYLMPKKPQTITGASCIICPKGGVLKGMASGNLPHHQEDIPAQKKFCVSRYALNKDGKHDNDVYAYFTVGNSKFKNKHGEIGVKAQSFEASCNE